MGTRYRVRPDVNGNGGAFWRAEKRWELFCFKGPWVLIALTVTESAALDAVEHLARPVSMSKVCR